MTTLERFNEVLQEITQPLAEVTPSTSLRSLLLDSLDLVELIEDLETEFGISIEDEAAEKFLTVSQILDYIDTALSRKESQRCSKTK